MADVKKAWERMKRGIKKELGISNGFYLKERQLQLRTATFLICTKFSYEDEISWWEKEDKRVQEHPGLSDERKARSHEDSLKWIEFWRARLETYGTKENEAKAVAEQFTNTNAYKQFAEEIGGCTWHIEQGTNGYYIRFNY